MSDKTRLNRYREQGRPLLIERDMEPAGGLDASYEHPRGTATLTREDGTAARTFSDMTGEYRKGLISDVEDIHVGDFLTVTVVADGVTPGTPAETAVTRIRVTGDWDDTLTVGVGPGWDTDPDDPALYRTAKSGRRVLLSPPPWRFGVELNGAVAETP